MEVKERPILFNGEMVRAILDGRKTQTRRMVKPQPEHVDRYAGDSWPCMWQDKPPGCDTLKRMVAPLGTIGDRLWVRETWRVDGIARGMALRFGDCKTTREGMSYRADMEGDRSCDDCDWMPSAWMPRWASRITLEITGVRVERVQEISDDDAESEGVDLRRLCGCVEGCATCDDRSPSEVFRDLWQSIYANWDANPWVWVYEFRRMKL